MKWVTRARPKTDRIACPWLIRRFIDPDAQILFVAAEQVLDVAAAERLRRRGLFVYPPLSAGAKQQSPPNHPRAATPEPRPRRPRGGGCCSSPLPAPRGPPPPPLSPPPPRRWAGTPPRPP